MATLKQYATNATRNLNEIERLQSEVKNLESELLETGSTKTSEDIQSELDALTLEMCVSECFLLFIL